MQRARQLGVSTADPLPWTEVGHADGQVVDPSTRKRESKSSKTEREKGTLVFGYMFHLGSLPLLRRWPSRAHAKAKLLGNYVTNTNHPSFPFLALVVLPTTPSIRT